MHCAHFHAILQVELLADLAALKPLSTTVSPLRPQSCLARMRCIGDDASFVMRSRPDQPARTASRPASSNLNEPGGSAISLVKRPFLLPSSSLRSLFRLTFTSTFLDHRSQPPHAASFQHACPFHHYSHRPLRCQPCANLLTSSCFDEHLRRLYRFASPYVAHRFARPRRGSSLPFTFPLLPYRSGRSLFSSPLGP